METQKMTIHRALSELKLIDSKIEKLISEITPVGINQKGKLIDKHISEEDFKKSAESKFNSVNDLIKRKILIKSAIVSANGKTSVKISGKDMTIADAINFKAILVHKKSFVSTLAKNYNTTVGLLNQKNEVVENNMQRILEATFGKENVKAGKDDVESVRKPYMEANEFHLFNPLEIKKKIEALDQEIVDFESEADAVLSEINAITIIEI